MKTLKDHIILYDSECPMCKVYTRAFISAGMLDTEGRAPYQEMPDFACPLVDPQRAVNEIALVDKATGEVKYGIDSLFKVIAHSFPVLCPLFAFKPFTWLMRKAYAFISYNRKVIIPAPKAAGQPTGRTAPQPIGHSAPQPTGPTAGQPTGRISGQSTSHSLQPAFRLRYRLAYLLFAAGVAGYLLTAYTRLLTGVLPSGNGYREYLICYGQILFQGMVVISTAPAKRWDYLGNMMTISLAGALLLLPAMAIAAITPLSPIIAAAYFLFVAGLMLLEHIRRSKLLSLGWGPTISWVFYRLLVLLLLLK